MNNYSFIDNPVERLHALIPDLLPGINKIITIHKNNSNHLSGLFSEKSNNEYITKDLELPGIRAFVDRFFEENNPYDWYSRSNLPFEIENKKNNPVLDIFSELHNVVLLIRLPLVKDETSTLVFIYLNENPSNFGVTNSINPLTTDNKSIIAFILRNTLLTLVRQEKQNKDLMKSNNKRFKEIIQRAETQKAVIKQTRESYGMSLIRLCHQYLVELTKGTTQTYKFSPDALEKIKNYKGELKDLKHKIKETLQFVQALHFDETGEIEITDWHIQFDGPEKALNTDTKPGVQDDKYAKTINLLNKLENAALKVKSQHMRLTGTNVGRSCPTPISAPAITDALYNHKSKINTLFNLYPEKWETIRREFRPVMNISRD